MNFCVYLAKDKHSIILTRSTKYFFFYSNTDVPQPIITSLKKQCNPSLKKSFKERNPDLDMDEIQNNPNIPDDIKAVLSGAVLDDDDDNKELTDAVPDASVEEILEKYDDLFMDESDDDLKITGRRGRKKLEDDEWFASARERNENLRKLQKPKPRGRPKRKSDEGLNGDATEKPEKIRKKVNRKKQTEDNSNSDSSASKTPKKEENKPKRPSKLPFDIVEMSKKFEGKIPNVKPATNGPIKQNGSTSMKSQMSTNKSVKHERKQNKNGIVHNKIDNNQSNISPITTAAEPVNKSAITYPNPSLLLKRVDSIGTNNCDNKSLTLSSLIGNNSNLGDCKSNTAATVQQQPLPLNTTTPKSSKYEILLK